MSECVLDLSDIIYALTISALRSEWKHIPCYAKMSPSKSQLVKLISTLSQTILDGKFEILI